MNAKESIKAFGEELKGTGKRNLLRKLTCITSSHGSKVLINGKRLINFSSNDYLNLSRHPEILKAAAAAMNKYGSGSGSSRLLSGTFLPHVKLEERIAKFKKTEAALVFNSGYAANTGIIPAISGDDAVIFSDELNHASIIDGIRLSKAAGKIYRHRDMDHLELLLKKSFRKNKIRRRLIITDTVFSMDGDIAPLRDVLSLCGKYDALLMIDDAHGTGVLGSSGRGGLEHFGIDKTDRIIQMGTLSKAAGCFGAFVAGPEDLIKLLVNKARSFMYSTSLPPSAAAACTKALDIVEHESGTRRRRLWNNRQRLYEGLKRLGCDTLGSETPIISVLTGDTKNALKAGNYLFRRNIFAPAIRPPTVEEGRCRIRFSVTAAHTKEDIDLVLESLSKIKWSA
ncbi:MAG: 8-amino-7-oxononanoate synthase [Nitrospiraceae bacterium]|nr:MAG: 8-amino-7-oxononanoate synthase [Nitrospiraceae bacterium]